jgi:hypothetical protein
MPDGAPGTMWTAYLKALETAEEEWWDGDRPAQVTAVAKAAGLDPEELWDRVEGKAGWESHDTGYQGMVWLFAWEMKGHPDWAGVTPVPRTGEEAQDDQWRLGTPTPQSAGGPARWRSCPGTTVPRCRIPSPS